MHATGQVCHLDVPADRWAALAPTWCGGSRACCRPTSGSMPSGRCRTFDARFSALWRRYEYRVSDALQCLPGPPPRHAGLAAAAGPRRAHGRQRAPRRRARLRRVLPPQGATPRRYGPSPHGPGGATPTRRWWRRWRPTPSARRWSGAWSARLPVGDGRRPVEWPASLLSRRARADEVVVAAPHGLTLVAIGYPDDETAYAHRASITRNRAARRPRRRRGRTGTDRGVRPRRALDDGPLGELGVAQVLLDQVVDDHRHEGRPARTPCRRPGDHAVDEEVPAHPTTGWSARSRGPAPTCRDVAVEPAVGLVGDERPDVLVGLDALAPLSVRLNTPAVTTCLPSRVLNVARTTWLQPSSTSSRPTSPVAATRQSSATCASPTRTAARPGRPRSRRPGTRRRPSEARGRSPGSTGHAPASGPSPRDRPTTLLSSFTSRYEPSPQVASTTTAAITPIATIHGLWCGRCLISGYGVLEPQQRDPIGRAGGNCEAPVVPVAWPADRAHPGRVGPERRAVRTGRRKPGRGAGGRAGRWRTDRWGRPRRLGHRRAGPGRGGRAARGPGGGVRGTVGDVGIGGGKAGYPVGCDCRCSAPLHSAALAVWPRCLAGGGGCGTRRGSTAAPGSPGARTRRGVRRLRGAGG